MIQQTQTRPTTAVGRGVRRPPVMAWLRLARVFQKIDRATANEMRGHDLTVAQFDVLAQVGAREGLTQKELAAALLVTKGNVCQLVDRMEARGLIKRQPARTGRGNHLVLTREGRRVRNEAVPAQEELIAAKFAVLSPADQEQLLTLLRKLDQSLDHPEER